MEAKRAREVGFYLRVSAVFFWLGVVVALVTIGAILGVSL